jgi:hypothetical protein
MTAWNRRTSEAVVISSTTLFRTNVACQAFIADTAARVRWFVYEPRCLTVDTDVSHRKLAAVLTLRINASARFSWGCLHSSGFLRSTMVPPCRRRTSRVEAGAHSIIQRRRGFFSVPDCGPMLFPPRSPRAPPSAALSPGPLDRPP